MDHLHTSTSETEDTPIQVPTEDSAAISASDHHKNGHIHIYGILTYISILATIASWCFFLYDSSVAFVLSAAAFIYALIGAIKVRGGYLRDLAITAAISSGVLIVVYCAFRFGIPYFFK